VGGGICDALLCEGRDALGVVEVEGARGVSTARKIGKFFNAEYPELETVRLCYPPIDGASNSETISYKRPTRSATRSTFR